MATGGHESQTEQAPPPARRRPGPVVVALVVVLALVAGGAAYLLLRGPSTTLRLVFRPGGSLRYQVNSHDRGKGQAADSAYDTRTEAPVRLAIGSVDPDGTATAAATVGPVTVRPSQLEPSDVGTLRDQTVRITADGRQLDAILVVADEHGRFFSLMDPLFPFLPPGAVRPGDDWSVDAHQGMPVGSGGTTFTGTATLASVDDGVAVVQADIIETWKLTAGAAQLSRLGGASSTGVAGTVAWKGTEHLHMTSRVDVARGIALGTTVAGRYDLTITSAGEDGNDGPLHNRGSFTQVARLVTG